MKVSGKVILNMVKDFSSFQMVVHTKGFISMGNLKELAVINGQMESIIKESGSRG